MGAFTKVLLYTEFVSEVVMFIFTILYFLVATKQLDESSVENFIFSHIDAIKYIFVYAAMMLFVAIALNYSDIMLLIVPPFVLWIPSIYYGVIGIADANKELSIKKNEKEQRK